MGVYVTPYVELAVGTALYASGDALGAKAKFSNVPEHGVIVGVKVIDRDKESVNLDVVLFTADIAGTAANDPFAPTDAELQTCLGAILVDVWKAFSDNSLGSVANLGFGYWAPAGVLYFQCVTRGTPTYTATDDVRVALSIVH